MDRTFKIGWVLIFEMSTRGHILSLFFSNTIIVPTPLMYMRADLGIGPLFVHFLVFQPLYLHKMSGGNLEKCTYCGRIFEFWWFWDLSVFMAVFGIWIWLRVQKKAEAMNFWWVNTCWPFSQHLLTFEMLEDDQKWPKNGFGSQESHNNKRLRARAYSQARGNY